MLFQPKGIDRHRGAADSGRAAQHPVARGVVEILFLVGGTHIPLGEVVEEVVGKHAGGAAGGNAPTIIDRGVDLAALAGAGRAGGVDAGQLVRLATGAVVVLGLPRCYDLAETLD